MERMKKRWRVSFQNNSLIDLFCRNLRRQRKQEYQERLRRKERERSLRDWEDNIRKEKMKIKEDDLKEDKTSVEEHTAEQKDELEDGPKPLAQKKTE